MPNDADIGKSLRVRADDFICNRQNVLWLLGQPQFYAACPAFVQLQPHVRRLHAFLVEHGLLHPDAALSTCTRCDTLKAIGAQQQLLNAFAQIFFWLYDRARMHELQTILTFVQGARPEPYRRLILAYAGKANKGVNRTAVVELPGDGRTQ